MSGVSGGGALSFTAHNFSQLDPTDSQRFSDLQHKELRAGSHWRVLQAWGEGRADQGDKIADNSFHR